MPAHRNDAKASAMAASYQEGLSLSQLAAFFGVTRQSAHRMLARRGIPMRHATPQEAVVWRGEKFTRRANGYFARTTGGREYLHREVWQAHNGQIPPGFDVHHVDEDKSNNDPANLTLHSSSEHGRRHGFGGNQYVPSLGRRPVKW